MYRLLACQRLSATKSVRSPFSAYLRIPSSCENNQICSKCLQADLCHLSQSSTSLSLSDGIRASSSNALQLRHQSTTTINPETVSKKKRSRKCHYGKYVDLLEVTDATASERKSRVKRLHSKRLDDFINKPKVSSINNIASNADGLPQPIEYQKVNLDSIDPLVLQAGVFDDKPFIFFGKEALSESVTSSPDGVNNILKSFNNFRDIVESIESEQNDLDAIGSANTFSPLEVKLNDQNDLDPLDMVEPYLKPNDANENGKSYSKLEAKTTTKSKSRFKSQRHSSEELESLAKQRALQTNLKSYLSVCVSSGALNRALSTVVAYRQRSKKSKTSEKSVISVELYNILLHGYAGKGAFDRFKYIFTFFEEDGINFNEQTFAAVLECLGRLNENEDNISTISLYIEQAEKMGYTLHQIMDKSKFILDQRDTVLSAIRRVIPDFSPEYTPPVLGYKNVLLNHLNENVQPIQSNAKANMNIQVEKLTNSNVAFNKEQLEDMARQQLQIELDGCIAIDSIEKTNEYTNTQYCREKLNELEDLWRSQISAAIIRDLNTLRAQIRFKPSGFMNYYTYLKALDTSEYAEIVIKEIYKLAEGSETFSPTVGQLYRELGQKVQQRYNIEQKKLNGTLEKMGQIYSSYCSQWEVPKSNANTRQMWQQLVHEARSSGTSMDIHTVSWPTHVLTGVGRFLYNVLMRDIKIDSQILRKKGKTKQHQNMLPAFYTLFRNQGRLVTEEVKPHPVLARLLRASRQQTLTFDSNLVPMLCPPQPWSTAHNGGYLLNKTELIRLPHQAIQQWERINSASLQSVYPALDSLNQLASIPWRVNTDILDIIIGVFQNGGDAKIDVPQPPSSLPPLPTIQKNDSSVTNEERAKLFREKLSYRRRQAEMYSLWCDTLYRLSLANHYRDKVFWLPHNMDFRGRVYPVPPHLNHLGSDLARSILIFDQAKPLGTDGFSWLKLHCINLTGLKKRDSVRERLLYAEDIMSEILDSADNPLTGRMWWSKSDEPWQTLACCIEIAKVYRSGDIEGYMSHFPIHQDGSCNGLQHYAALGRDKTGAFSVNLAPSEIPQDVYSSVAALVEKARKSDAANGLHVAQALDGYVRRKVIKQTVMTTVYGVTRYGARLQIARQLKDIEDFPREWVWPASTYLTTKTFESLREMFTSTREIQDWFTDCARLISSVCVQNVEWVTPLGLPVVQPYNRQELKPSNIRLGSRIPEALSMDLFERPNVMKQKNAFPPNFIHSLDSSHMMLTSLHCERERLTFVSVHDCFWTHACTVPDLNRICREQFVALHSQPILEDLSKFLQERFKKRDITNDGSTEDLSKRHLNRILRQMPQKGDFDLNEVLKSVYFFS